MLYVGLPEDPKPPPKDRLTVAFHRQTRQSTRSALRYLLAATFFVVLAMALAAAWGFHAVGKGAREELKLTQALVDTGYALQLALDQQTINSREYLLTGDGHALAAWQAAHAAFAAQYRALAGAALAPAQQRQLEDVRRFYDRWEAVSARAMALARTGEQARGATLLDTEAIPLRRQLTSSLDAFTASTRQEIAQLHQQVAGNEHMLRNLLGLVVLLNLPVLALLGWFASQRVLRPLKDLERSAIRFGQGDSTARVEILANDEFGAVAGAFNTMAERVEGSLASVREGEARIRTVLDALQEGVLVQGPDRAVLLVNPSAEQILGLKLDQMMGRARVPDTWRLVRPDLTEYPADELPDAVTLRTGRGCKDVELGVVRPDGSLAWLLVTSQPLALGGKTAPASVVSSFFDVTKRKQTEAQLRQFELLIRTVTDYAIIMLDREGRVVSWNKGAEALKGYHEAEILGQSFKLFYTPADIAAGRPEHLLREAAEHGHVEEEAWRVRQDGSRFWADVVVTALRNERGDLAGYAKVTRDLTERKQAQEAAHRHLAELAHQRTVLSSIIDHVPAAIAYLDRDLVYQWNNAAHCQMAGLPKERIIGHRLRDVFPSAKSAADGVYEQVFRSGEAHFVSEMALPRHEQGETIVGIYDVAYLPISEDGRIDAVLVVATDVSGRVAKDRAQQKAIATLRDVDRMKDEFLSVLSHELRTPINALMGFGSILDDEVSGPLNPEQHKFVQKILDGSEVLLALVNDLLDMGRITAGKLTLECGELDFRQVARNAVSILAPLAVGKQQTLECVMSESVPHVVGDEQRIRQILTNLIGNAIKFTPDGGRIEVRACTDRGRVRCEVLDNGIGIATKDVPRLFQRFTQLDSGYTRKAGGTGLGLSISKALVEAHGGEIGVESVEGQGSTFWFTLPAADRDAPA